MYVGKVIGVPFSDIVYVGDFFPDYFLSTSKHFDVSFSISAEKIFGSCLC